MMMIRIQFHHYSSSSVPVETFQHSKSPIVACLCPIILVAEDASIMNHSSATGSTLPPDPPQLDVTLSSLSSMHDALHLVSAATLLNTGMMFHRMALRSSHTNGRGDNTMDQPSGTTLSARCCMRAMELYELLIQLFHKDSRLEMIANGINMHSNDFRALHFMPYMQMMKTITYNNYAQLCYEAGNYFQYVSCMNALYRQIIQSPVTTALVVACHPTTVASSSPLSSVSAPSSPGLPMSDSTMTNHRPTLDTDHNHYHTITDSTATSGHWIPAASTNEADMHDATATTNSNVVHRSEETNLSPLWYSTNDAAVYEPIRATIYLNVLVYQILTIPQAARAA
jgi:hypothetical protein